jgi:hypothetical protein
LRFPLKLAFAMTINKNPKDKLLKLPVFI